MDSTKIQMLWFLLLLIVGCSGTMDDIAPSGTDKSPTVHCGIPGPFVCQFAPDFTLDDTTGTNVTLSSVISLPGVKGTVIYFTMWCPVCDAHMSHMRSAVMPVYPDMRYLVVDYVSGSVSAALTAEMENGYVGSGFTVLAETQQEVLNLYEATMGTTVVVDTTGVIRMNEDYKDGSRLAAVLAGLP